MTRILTLIAGVMLALSSVGAQAQTLKPAQLVAACTACKGNPACNTPRIAGDTGQVMSWLNGARTPETLAWNVAGSEADADEAPNYQNYDTLAQGKRDSWERFLARPRNYTKASIRNWVVDIWGTAISGSNAEKVLQAATFNATNVQSALGGTTRSTGTVSALDLSFTGSASADDATWLVQRDNCQ